MRNHRTSRLYALGLVLGTLTLPAGNATAQDWEWSITPYVWGSTTSADLYINDNQVIGAELDFADLVDKLDFAAQMHVEGRKDKLGFLFDVTFLNTGDSFTVTDRPVLPDGTVFDTDVKQTVIEVGGFYRPSGGQTGFDLLAGARIIDADMDIDITVPDEGSGSASSSDTLTDGFIGGRYSTPLAEKWFMALRGDVGAGDSDLAWNVSAIFGYQFGQNNKYSFLFGYRHLVLEFKDTITVDGESVDTEMDLTMTGPEIGLTFKF